MPASTFLAEEVTLDKESYRKPSYSTVETAIALPHCIGPLSCRSCSLAASVSEAFKYDPADNVRGRRHR